MEFIEREHGRKVKFSRDQGNMLPSFPPPPDRPSAERKAAKAPSYSRAFSASCDPVSMWYKMPEIWLKHLIPL